jgi:hypothetical protein
LRNTSSDSSRRADYYEDVRTVNENLRTSADNDFTGALNVEMFKLAVRTGAYDELEMMGSEC